MITFGNAIVAGTTLVREDIRSQDYVPGVSGWAIFANGDAEFNNGTFRGELTAGSITAGSIGNSTIVNSEFDGGNINNTAIYLDDAAGGLILVYAVTSTTTTVTASGPFNVPLGVTSIDAGAWGGGGGGFAGKARSGGGGGEFSRDPAITVIPGEVLTVTVGAGGGNGVPGAFSLGSPGGDTALQRSGTDLIRAHGGAGGTGGTALGGSGSGDPVHFSGGNSMSTFAFPTGGGSPGGGTAAGRSAAGNSSGSVPAAPSVTGAAAVAAPSGGGSGGAGGNGSGANGTAGGGGVIPGGGGGAGGTGTVGSANGGAGARGQVEITYLTGQQLVASISPTAGVDGFGNAYPQGVSSVSIRENGESLHPKLVRKTVAQSVTSSTALVNDNALFVSLTPGTWRIECFLQWNGDSVASGVGDIQTAWTTTGTMTTVARTLIGGGTNFVSATQMPVRMQGAAIGTPLISEGNATSTNHLREDILMDVAATGVLQLQWAQASSSVVSTNVAVSSRLYVTRLS